MKKMKKGLSVVLASTLLIAPFSSMAEAQVQYRISVQNQGSRIVYSSRVPISTSYRIRNLSSQMKIYIRDDFKLPSQTPAEIKETPSNSGPQGQVPQPKPTPQPQPKEEVKPAPAPQPTPQEPPAAQQPAESPKFQAGVYEMLGLINEERAKVGASPLQLHEAATFVAQEKSDDMVRNNYFSHTSPTYGSPFDMLKTFGISYSTAGENIAINSSVQRAHAAFMNSDGHRRNILNPNFTHVGIGIAKDAANSNSYRITQMFVTPR
ncbi:MAG: CAP domain-containing protein [Thermotaleaceae bacterium]